MGSRRGRPRPVRSGWTGGRPSEIDDRTPGPFRPRPRHRLRGPRRRRDRRRRCLSGGDRRDARCWGGVGNPPRPVSDRLDDPGRSPDGDPGGGGLLVRPRPGRPEVRSPGRRDPGRPEPAGPHHGPRVQERGLAPRRGVRELQIRLQGKFDRPFLHEWRFRRNPGVRRGDPPHRGRLDRQLGRGRPRRRRGELRHPRRARPPASSRSTLAFAGSQ